MSPWTPLIIGLAIGVVIVLGGYYAGGNIVRSVTFAWGALGASIGAAVTAAIVLLLVYGRAFNAP